MGVLDGGLHAEIIQLAAPVAVDTSGIGNWLRDNAVKVILIVIGLVILMASRRGDHSRVVSVVGLSLIGLMVNGVFRELGAAVEARMARVSALHGSFIGHIGSARGPNKTNS